MNKTKLIDAYNKALEVFESFDRWRGSGIQGPPGAMDWGRPDLIEEGNKLLRIMRESLKKPEFTDKEFLSFSDRIAKLVSTEVGEEIGQGAVTKALKRADIDYVGKARKILPEIEALDKLVKKALVFLKVNQKF